MTIASALAVMLTVTGAVAPQAGPVPVPVDWSPCGTHDSECATVRMPIDWARPHGPSFDLRIARHRTTDSSARIGTLIYGPGGPGDSGVNAVTSLGRFTAEQVRRFDIVSFDPRGVGASNPMPCAVADNPVIANATEFQQRVDTNRAAWQQCHTRYGELWNHADTASTVRDVDALRALLGERQISIHGTSYGTMVGELYAERYPARVRAVVLESAIDHSQDTRGFLETQGWALQDSFDAFAGWCTQTGCGLPEHDAHAAFAEALRMSDSGELRPGCTGSCTRPATAPWSSCWPDG